MSDPAAIASYDATAFADPTYGPLFQIRFLIGDTDADGTGAWKFSDAEIIALAPGGVLAQPSITAAAVALCHRLVARYSGLVDVSEGGASAQMSQLATHYRALARELALRAGISATALVSAQTADGTYEPAFTRAMGSPVYP